MEQAIRQKDTESVDVCTRYSSMQYLIILFEADETKNSKYHGTYFRSISMSSDGKKQSASEL